MSDQITSGKNQGLENGIGQMNDISDQKGANHLADIERRLDKLEADRLINDRPSKAALPEGMAAIMGRVATELVAGVIVGTFIGWMLDRWLDTSPLFLVVMFFLGSIAGMLNVWRVSLIVEWRPVILVSVRAHQRQRSKEMTEHERF